MRRHIASICSASTFRPTPAFAPCVSPRYEYNNDAPCRRRVDVVVVDVRRARPSLDRSTGEGQKRGPAPVRGERARVVDATTDGTSTGVDSGRGEFYPRESTRSGGLGRVAVTARGSTTRLRVRAMSRVFLLSAKSREGGLVVWVCDDDETDHWVDARGLNCETDVFLFFRAIDLCVFLRASARGRSRSPRRRGEQARGEEDQGCAHQGQRCRSCR